MCGSRHAATSYVPKPPKFSWDTMPVFIHGSNQSGPINAEAIHLMAKFPLVTVEKFQGPCGWRPNASPRCDQEAQIIGVLKNVKGINPNVSTIFCTQSVLSVTVSDRPPHTSLTVLHGPSPYLSATQLCCC